MNKTVVVTNRSNSLVGYKIPELHVQRRFRPNESKTLSIEEVRALSWIKGGKTILENHLIISDEGLVKEILNSVEPEYYYTAQDIAQLLLYGSEDQLLDALDFGGDGVRDLIKDQAVALKLNDLRKRNIIKEKTSFDVSGAIDANEASNVVAQFDTPKARRAAPIGEEAAAATQEPARRSEAIKPKYTVTVKQK